MPCAEYRDTTRSREDPPMRWVDTWPFLTFAALVTAGLLWARAQGWLS